jgi:hypothetical protein
LQLRSKQTRGASETPSTVTASRIACSRGVLPLESSHASRGVLIGFEEFDPFFEEKTSRLDLLRSRLELF